MPQTRLRSPSHSHIAPTSFLAQILATLQQNSECPTTGVTTEGMELDCLTGPSDATYNVAKNCYNLKRKNTGEGSPIRKRPRISTDSSSLLGDADLAEKLRAKNFMLVHQLQLVQRHLAQIPGSKSSSSMKEWYQSVIATKKAGLDRLSEEYKLRNEFIVVAVEYGANKKLKGESEALMPWLPQDTPREMTSDYLCVNVRALGVQKLHMILDQEKFSVVKKGLHLQKDMRDIGASMV